MMTAINKWVCLLSLGVSIVMLDIIDILIFIYEHHIFLVHLVSMGLLSTLGQMFVYRMIKQFKQHFVPFVITTRKIITVGLSILYYQHETNVGQIVGIVLVFTIVTYEFVSELMSEKSDIDHHGAQ
jgi:drug/metabolite transporter (DMT)-like permease